jgi:signal peptidase I
MRSKGLRKVVRLTAAIAFIATVSFWALFLRPHFLGGPASYLIVSGTSMDPTLHTGDLVVAVERPSYRVGDIISYHVPSGPGKGALIIHRIIGGSAQIGFLTKGDNRQGPDDWHPKGADVDGQMVLQVPRAGDALTFLHTPLGLAMLSALVAFLVMRSGNGEALAAAKIRLDADDAPLRREDAGPTAPRDL